MRGMFRYCVQQLLWMISVTAQLIAAMGVGVKWITMTLRLMGFAILDLAYFIPQVCWYMLSPNIIRRVAYRSSPRTKRRNVEIFLKSMMESQPESAPDPDARDGSDPSPPRGRPRSISLSGQQSVELLASALNPADGRIMSALPFNGDAEDLSHQLISNVSFSQTVGILNEYYTAHYANAVGGSAPSPSSTYPGAGHTSAQVKNARKSSAPNFSMGELSTMESDEEEDEEDGQNLHNRATLDIYLPVPLDSLFRMMEQEKNMPYRSKLRRKKFPIIISVNGGAWIVGCYFWNFLVARLLAARGYVVFCPDYRNFPQTDLEGMVLDVSDAVSWVLQNAERYNGDLDNVTVVGQSAGAHLTMMSLLSQAHIHAHKQEGGQAPSGVAYNVPRYNPRQSIHRYIGLSGIYNLRGLVKHFHRRGLYRSVLYQLAGGRANLPRYSLNSYFDDRRKADTGEVLPDCIFDFFPKRMFFIHGDADCSAPLAESANIAYVMRNTQRDTMLSRLTSVELAKKRKSTAPPSLTGSPMSPKATTFSDGETKDPMEPSDLQSDKNISSELPLRVSIEWILIPDASHTDPIVEEVLLEGRSCLVDFLCDYEALSKKKWRRGQLRIPNGGSENSLEEEEGLLGGYAVPYPDAVLPLCVPYKKRPLLMRLSSFVCPF